MVDNPVYGSPPDVSLDEISLNLIPSANAYECR